MRMISSAGFGSFKFPAAIPAVDGGPFLTDNFSAGLTVVYATTWLAGSYSGPLFQVKRISDGQLTDIMAGSDAAVAAAVSAAISGSTGVVPIVYDQMGTGANLTATTGNEPSIIIDTDGLASIKTPINTTKKLTTTSTVVKVTNPHVFFVAAPALPDNVQADASLVVKEFYSYTGGNGTSAPRWGLFTDQADTFYLGATRNGSDSISTTAAQYGYSMAHIGDFHVWDVSHSTCVVRIDTEETMNNGTASANISYPSTQTLVVGGSVTNANPGHGRWRVFALYGSTQNSTTRNAISNLLVSECGVTKLSNTVGPDADGFTWTRKYQQPMFQLYGPDALGMYAKDECTTYAWGRWEAANVNNGVVYTRYEVRPYDNDTVLNGSERSERDIVLAGDVSFVRGQTVEEYFDIRINGPTQSGDWCDTAQIHTNTNNIPVFAVLEIRNGQFIHTAQRSSGDTSSSPVSFTTNVWYSVRRRLVVSTNGTSDVFQVWQGPHGTTLTQVLNATGGVFPNATEEPDGGYIKEGIYRGFPGANAGTIVVEIANHQWKKTGDYSAYVTSQPPLPTHA